MRALALGLMLAAGFAVAAPEASKRPVARAGNGCAERCPRCGRCGRRSNCGFCRATGGNPAGKYDILAAPVATKRNCREGHGTPGRTPSWASLWRSRSARGLCWFRTRAYQWVRDIRSCAPAVGFRCEAQPICIDGLLDGEGVEKLDRTGCQARVARNRRRIGQLPRGLRTTLAEHATINPVRVFRNTVKVGPSTSLVSNSKMERR